MHTEEKYLSKKTFGLMLGTALLFDCFNWIPVLGTVINVLAFSTFWFWLRVHGIKFTGKRATTMLISGLIELIPFLQVIPGWTLAIIIIYVQSKAPKSVQKVIQVATKE